MTYYSEILKDNPMLHYSINYNNIPLDNNGLLPVVYWPIAPNFGDLLSPWLMNKITGKTVRQAKSGERSYCVIGSILKRANDNSIVWGTGAFGTERRKQI